MSVDLNRPFSAAASQRFQKRLPAAPLTFLRAEQITTLQAAAQDHRMAPTTKQHPTPARCKRKAVTIFLAEEWPPSPQRAHGARGPLLSTDGLRAPRGNQNGACGPDAKAPEQSPVVVTTLQPRAARRTSAPLTCTRVSSGRAGRKCPDCQASLKNWNTGTCPAAAA